MWAPIMASMVANGQLKSILEVGANVGHNLHALRRLTDADLHAVEPNKKARKVLWQRFGHPKVLNGSTAGILLPDGSIDMVFTCGVLIHIDPDELEASCREMYRVAKRYIVCIEYFSDQPQAQPWRGHELFKRDFGSYWLDLFDMETVNYGFTWKRLTGFDNFTWWVFRK